MTVRASPAGSAPGPSGARSVHPSHEELAARIELTLLPGVGDRLHARLLERFGSARAALRAPSRQVAPLAGEEAAAVRGDPELRRRAERALERCRELDIRVVARSGPGYPEVLDALHDPPALLFLRGDPGLLGAPRAVAVVGSRRATVYGRRVTRALAEGLARRGVTVVSGMALGIDGCAHEGALDGGGDTVAVLGSGPERAHPRSHARLYRRIVEEGLIVSEFLPGEPAFAHNFPRRNRIIAALSAGIVVAEAGVRSGAFITVDHGLDLGRDVFAVPGSVESRMSRGTHALIRQGASLVTSAHDIVAELGWLDSGVAGAPDEGRRTPETAAVGGAAGNGGARGAVGASAGDRGPGSRFGADALEAWKALDDGPAHPDHVARTSGLGPRRALAALSLLEIEGWVAQQPGGRFARRLVP